ncbi:MAG: arginine N-succinyltransferase [Myxococcales bacterium]
MFVIRNVTRSDLPGLKRLAEMLNTVNLPDDEKTLSELIEKSVRSFNGTIKNPFEREYLFVAEDTRKQLLVGTSMVIAQHGTYEAPHVYLEVSEREHYSHTIDAHMRHKVLSIGYNYDGPTEIGGLIVDPNYRKGETRLGKQLSFVRFLFMAMHRKNFRAKVLAELLPPLLPDGRSLLWEAFGRKFTGLTYQEADRLSRGSKEFIKEMFPNSDVYATLFPPRVQKVIGRVGPETVPVQRMLERIGFRYVERIDPFDGGPHFEAPLADISVVRKYRRLKVSDRDLTEDAEVLMLGVEEKGKYRFRSVRSPVRIDGEECTLPAEVKQCLAIGAGDKVHAIPLE